MSFVGSNILAGASGQGGGGYEIERSLRFNAGDTAYLSKTFSSDGNRRTNTISFWIKKVKNDASGAFYRIFGSQQASHIYLYEDKIFWDISTTDNASAAGYRWTNRLFRDPSAWYHIVCALDTTQSTASNRMRLYVNGVEETSFQATTNMGQNDQTGFSQGGIEHTFGYRSSNQGSAGGALNAYLADVHFIDGQALAATDFGETDDNGVWQPKEFAGTYATPASTVLVGSPSYPSSFTSSGNKTSDQTGLSFGSWAGTYTGAETKIFKKSNTTAFSLQLSLAGPTTDRLLWYSDNATDWTYVGNVSSLSNPYTLSGHKYYATSEGSGSATVTASSPATGVNSFHLPFSDNSSNAALGTDTSGNSNTWTVNNLIAAGESISTSAITNVSSVDNTRTISVTAAGWQTLNNAVDNSDSTVSPSNNNTPGTITFSPALVGVTKVRAKTRFYGSGTAKLYNGTTELHSVNHNNNNATQYYTIYEGAPIEITQYWQQMNSSAASDDFWALEINDTIVATNTNGGNLSSSISGASITLTTTNNSNYSSFSVGDSVNNGATINAKNSGTPSITVDAGSWSNGDYIVKPSNANADNLRDTPTNGTQTDTGAGGEITGNYATFNRLAANQSAGGITISNGNLDITRSGGSNYFFDTTMSFSSGKWYWEMTVGSTISSYPRTGIWNRSSNNNGYPAGADHRGWGAIGIAYSTSDISNGLPTFGVNDILMFAMDLDNGKLWFGKNGTWYSTGTNTVTAANIANNTATARFTDLLTESTGATWTPIVHMNSGDSWVFNAGQRSFAFSAPTGFKSLNTANLPEPTIADGSKYFDTKLYTGNGTNGRNITGFSFSPDFVWVKGRNAAAGHGLQDIVRGPGNTVLASHTTGAEGSETYGQISSFDSDGFTVTSGSSGDENINYLNRTFVAWAWDAGSSNTTIAAGGLNSSVYDQSQNWSSYMSNSSGADNLFDGVLTNYYGPDGNTQTFIPSNAITVSASLEIWYKSASTSRNFEVNDNGSTIATGTSASGKWVNLNFTGSLTKISGTNGWNVAAIKIDGKILVNSGTTPPNVPTIASTVRANPSAGFSIITYAGNSTSGATIGHGLNTAPEFVVVKARNTTQGWCVYHASLGATKYVQIDTTNAAVSYSGTWNNTSPTSSVFTVGNDNIVNTGYNYVAYCFAPVAGYSAMGSYTGNGSADGTFVFTGFRPRWVMHKRTDTGGVNAGDWRIWDTSRDIDNAAEALLFPAGSNAEASNAAHGLDILSNGFKLRTSDGNINPNGGTYIYAAFAEHPFKTARAR